MSMPSSKITVPSSNTDATSNPQQNTSEKINQASNTDLNSDKNIHSRYQKLNRINNPTPSTSKVEIEKEEETLDCPGSPSHCKASRLPLSQAKTYICNCNPIDDPKPGPSTSAAEFDLEVFDSCSSGSLEDCWGPDCHHSSCETSPVIGDTSTTILARSGSRNKDFHRKGNKRQLSGSGIPECSNSVPSLNKASTSSGIFALNNSKQLKSVYHHNFYDRSNTTLGEFSDNSSEDDFIMSSPGRAITTHGQHYEPTSACPSETEDANLSDEREDELEENNGSLYQKGTRNSYSTTETMSVQEISNTSMDVMHPDVNELTDAEEEEQEEEIINASGLRNNLPTSNSNSHNLELFEDNRNNSEQHENEQPQAEKEGQNKESINFDSCISQHNGQSSTVPTSQSSSGRQCHEGIILASCRCSQITRLESKLPIHDESKATESYNLASTLLNEELPSMISCKNTTVNSQVEKLSSDAHASSDNDNVDTHQSQEISIKNQPDDITSNQDVSNLGLTNSSEPISSNKTNICTTKNVKGSPLPSTSETTAKTSPHISHFICHSHIHHHHIHHSSVPPSIVPQDLNPENETNEVQDCVTLEKEMNAEIETDKKLEKPLIVNNVESEEARANESPSQAIRGTTQDAMSADNVDEIVQDHDNFGTDENEDSLDSVATLSLNEMASQDEEDSSNSRSFQFSIKNHRGEFNTSNLDILEVEESGLDTSGGLSGTKRKPEACTDDTPGPSIIKKKRTTATFRDSSSSVNDVSPLNSTPLSAPRITHKSNNNGIRGVSDVNMASTAFNLDEQDHEEADGNKNGQLSNQDENIVGRAIGRQRFWSAGTLNTEEEICSVTSSSNNRSSKPQSKSDSLDIVSDLSTCETVALALPCSISSSKNVFANVHSLESKATPCCKCPIQICSKVSNESSSLSEYENQCLENDHRKAPFTHPSCEEKEDSNTFSNIKNEESEFCDSNEIDSISNTSYPANDETSNTLQVSPSVHQQLTKLIPDKNYPPNDILEWKDSFSRWSNAKRLLAIDQLISMCEPQQVRHMMAVIEPQFQRDFISLLPKELALYVLSFLKPRDLLNAAQTCRYWRILAEDNLLWREKCREAGLGESVAEMFNIRAKSHSKRINCLSGIDYSSWKLGYMREHNIECNWRVRPIKTTKVLKGHDDHVITCLQFSNNKIVSGSDDNTLKVWNASTGRCLRTLVGHTGGVWSSQMEGNTIVSGSTDRSLKIWNAESGECVHTLYGHTSTVRCMHLHNNLVVSGSRDATLRMWDISSGECLHVLMGHVAAVRCVQFDGRLVVSGAYDYMVKVWNPLTEECLHTLSGHTNRVYSLQFDGIHVVSGSLDTSIRVWDVETGSCKHALMGHQSLTSGMELKDNILVSGNADSTVKVWDITNGQCLQTLSGPNKHQSAVTCLQFDSKFVVTSSDDGTVKLWDVKTGDFIRDLVALKSGGSGGVVWRIRASATKLVCAVGSRNGTEETKLLVLDFDAPLEK